MHDTAELVAELQDKLAELDLKVATYRQEMAAEFQRYSRQLLLDAPNDISGAVSQAISESMSKYPSLRLDQEALSPDDADTAITDRRRWHGRNSPPPSLRHTSAKPKDIARGPHEREQEFHGLFTPTYLPLLDGNDRPHHSPPTSPALGSDRNTSEGTQTMDSPSDSGPPLTRRRLTDSSSFDSNESEAKTRRSALRRSSSSSNRTSPRRVRFDFEGEEVLPTASPQASEPNIQQAGSDVVTAGSTHDSGQGTNVLDDNATEDYAPPARKVSSSERLRALSKLPLEDPSTWRVVNSQPDTSESAIMDDASSVPDKLNQKERLRERGVADQDPAAAGGGTGSPLQDFEEYEDSDSSEDDFISMRPGKKSPVSQVSRSPVPASAARPVPQTEETEEKMQGGQEKGQESPAGSKSTASDGIRTAQDIADVDAAGYGSGESDHQDDSDDGDELFEFDEDAVGFPLTRSTKPARDPPASSSRHVPEVESTKNKLRAAGPSSPPTVALPGQGEDSPVSPSMGSYKGRQITTFDVVKDIRVHEQAAELGDFNTFVGSVDGRSGFDGSDLNSFRASLSKAQYSGTPRSMSERMAMEDAMAHSERMALP